MRAESFPARAGWGWLVGGFALFRRRPGFLNFLWFSTWMMVVSVSLFPFIGQAVASVILPVLLVGIVEGCRAIERNRPLTPSLLFAGFAPAHRRTLLRIGVVYLLVSSLVFGLSVLLANDALQPLLSGKESPASIDPAVARSLMTQLLVTLQVALVLSAPALIAAPLAVWEGLTVGKALFFAMVGIWRNLAPLAVLYLSLTAIAVGLPVTVALGTDQLPDSIKSIIQLPVMLALLFVLMPTALASYYLALRDIFQRREPAE